MLAMKSASRLSGNAVEIYYKGELLSTHTRLVGKNLFSYHLDRYMLCLGGGRAIFDAAPVKQNIPPEVLEELKTQKKHDNVINLLEHFAAKTAAEAKPVISDPCYCPACWPYPPV